MVTGSARVKIDDDVIELGAWDAVRVPPKAQRSFEGGPDGAELVAFGAPNTDNKDAEMQQGWWEYGVGTTSNRRCSRPRA